MASPSTKSLGALVRASATLIALFLYEKLLAEEPQLAARVSSVVLSGLGLEPFDELIERQVREMPPRRSGIVRAALRSCDWGVLKKQLAISCEYLEDAYARPSGRSVFESLARRAPAAKFFVFQGNQDAQTPVRFARALDAWNARSGHLDLILRYYDGAHVGGPPEVKRELSDLLLRLSAPRPSVRTAGAQLSE